MKRLLSFACLPLLAWSLPARAEEPRFHVVAGGARAVGGEQSSEFATGGAGSGTVELPATSRLGLQGSAGAMVLSKGDSPKDGTVAAKSTGAAFLGTVGVRIRGYGETRVAGPWMDVNGGVAHTGDLTRPAFDAHVGWDFRVPGTGRLDVGPFVGYTQIFQPDAELRGSDARVLVGGFSVSIGKKERARPAAPIGPEKSSPPPEPQILDRDAFAEAYDVCSDGDPPGEFGCAGEVRLFEDRILLDDVVHFAFDSATIRERSYRLVRNIARFITAQPDIIDISIEGHADQVGTEVYNQRLSEARARSMRDLLVRYGVAGSRLRVVARGKSRPKVATLTREEQNRRVELFVTRERESKSVASAPGRDSR